MFQCVCDAESVRVGQAPGRGEGDGGSRLQEERSHLLRDRALRRLLPVSGEARRALTHEHTLPPGRRRGAGGAVPQGVQAPEHDPVEGSQVNKTLTLTIYELFIYNKNIQKEIFTRGSKHFLKFIVRYMV